MKKSPNKPRKLTFGLSRRWRDAASRQARPQLNAGLIAAGRQTSPPDELLLRAETDYTRIQLGEIRAAQVKGETD